MANVQQTLFWYDLETSGTEPRRDRIMQFAGQRTTLDLEKIGEPVNVMIKMPPDVLPQPDAIMITGITPQMTITDGLTEVEFLKLFTEEVATPGTIFVGFNTVRFDDEFMRFLHYRNFYDAYEWQWKDSRGRWDLLDVVRLTRALRPEGIEWPVVDGVASNRLELLTKANNISHDGAHDALSDVNACIDVAKLIKTKQPKLFGYMLSMRSKQKVAELVDKNEPFVYASGKYPTEFEKTSVVVKLTANPHAQGSFVYDLRHDPTLFLKLTPAKLAERWRWTKDQEAPPRLPVKTLQYNRCPAVAPLSVLDTASQKRIKIDLALMAKHNDLLREHPDFVRNVVSAVEILESERKEYSSPSPQDDERLYENFIGDEDRKLMSVMRAASPDEISEVAGDFRDERLRGIAPLYKARNFPNILSETERKQWEQYRYDMLMLGGMESRLAKFMHRLQELATETGGRGDKMFLLEELQLYAESIMPVADV